MNYVDSIILELVEAVTPRMISDKIDSTFGSFQLPAIRITSHQEFNGEIAHFIQHIYLRGITKPITLDNRKALTEAIYLLDSNYESSGAAGYDAAYLEVVDESGKGLDYVLTQLAETVKNLEAQKWINAFYLQNINPIDKRKHFEIIKYLFEKYPEYFPDNIKVGNPIRFCKHYRELIATVLQSESFIRHLQTSS